jgi:hypothetical protein
MSLVPWFPESLFHRAPGLNKGGSRQPWRQPTRSRPSLEHLEERTLLDGSGALPGADTLGSDFAPFSIGLALPTGANVPSTTGVTTQVFPSSGAEMALGAASSLGSENQSNSQFRDFATNSEGVTDQVYQTTINLLINAYGFGSGTQPNRPWAPAAYNLGLANNQYGYPSQSDLGFSVTPPWFRPTAQSLPQDPSLDAEDGDLMPESPLLHQATKDHGQDERLWMDEGAHDKNENQTAPMEKPAEEEQTEPEEAALDWTRSDPAIEDALFSEPLHSLTAASVANHRNHAVPTLSSAKHAATSNENKMEGPAAEESSIPSSLWVSALAPAQMAALVAGMPGVEAPAQGCEAAIGSASE